MTFRLRTLAGAAALGLLVGAPAVSAGQHEDKAAVEAAVFDYFHGQGEASAERLQRAFADDHASMVGVVEDDAGNPVLRSWKDMSQVLDNWAANDNPPGGGRDGEILSMEMVDGRLAVVLFRSADRFYDALTLAKVDGEWKIVAKAFVVQ